MVSELPIQFRNISWSVTYDTVTEKVCYQQLSVDNVNCTQDVSNISVAVSYTHLDVYKRQVIDNIGALGKNIPTYSVFI